MTGVLGVSQVAGVLGVWRGDHICHAYFTISISDFDFFSFTSIFVTYTFRVRYLSSYLYPGILSMGIPDTRVTVERRT